MAKIQGDTAVTELLGKIALGESGAKERLFETLYPKLHEIAEAALRRERRDHTLQPTALVNEAAVKLMNSSLFSSPGDRLSFLAAAGRAMKEVLVDHARARKASKRPFGDGREKLPLDEAVESFQHSNHLDLVALDECLTRLQSESPRKHDIVLFHFFGGMKFKEIADYMDVSLSTVEKDWQFARAWLRRALES